MGAKRTFFWENIASEDLWYLVGLITSDGCLSSDGRHIDITAKDKYFLRKICSQIKLKTPVSKKYGGYKGLFSFRIQFSSKSFTDFLLKIGLTPRKSLTLGALDIPDRFFNHFLRGVIDGDGSIRHWHHPQNGIEQWIVKVTSGSQKFLEWLRDKIKQLYGLSGALLQTKERKIFDLKYGKLAAQALLKITYVNDCIALARKKQMAVLCIATKKGWSTSKTIEKNARVSESVYEQDSNDGSPCW